MVLAQTHRIERLKGPGAIFICFLLTYFSTVERKFSWNLTNGKHQVKKQFRLIRLICGEIHSYRVRFHMSAFLTRLYQAFARHLSLICGGFYGHTFIIIIKVQFYFCWNSSNLATVSEKFLFYFLPQSVSFALFELT